MLLIKLVVILTQPLTFDITNEPNEHFTDEHLALGHCTAAAALY